MVRSTSHGPLMCSLLTLRLLFFRARFPRLADVRFPTSLTGDGTDAMNTDCDYSSAYVTLLTDTTLAGHGMTFTIGRGNDIVCAAIRELAERLVGKKVEELFANMGATWDYLCADPQLRWFVIWSLSGARRSTHTDSS